MRVLTESDVMRKLGILALIAGALVGCASGSGTPALNTSYAWPGHCHSYDYSNTGFGGCGIGSRWH